MTAKSKMNGHDIEYVKGDWIYSDTKESTMTQHGTRSCSHCKQFCTPEGHDACLGTLPNVKNACCGHGVPEDAYVQFNNDSCVYSKDALTLMYILKKSTDKSL
nr:hypothetical protein [Paenibacillus xylanexedens]